MADRTVSLYIRTKFEYANIASVSSTFLKARRTNSLDVPFECLDLSGVIFPPLNRRG